MPPVQKPGNVCKVSVCLAVVVVVVVCVCVCVGGGGRATAILSFFPFMQRHRRYILSKLEG